MAPPVEHRVRDSRAPLLSTCPLCDQVLFEAHRCPRRIGGPRRSEDFAAVLLRLWPHLGDRQASAETRATVRDINSALDGSTVGTSALGVLTCDDYLQALRSLAGLEEHLRNFEPVRGVVTRRAVAAPPRATTTRTTLLTTAHQAPQAHPRKPLSPTSARAWTDTWWAPGQADLAPRPHHRSATTRSHT